MIIQPKIRGFVCVTAHPMGCALHVDQQIAHVSRQGPLCNGPRNVLVVGSSTGYGLASRIAAAVGGQARTFGLFYERPPGDGRLATAGWYNNSALEARLHDMGLYAESMNGDAFSDETKTTVLARIREEMGPLDMIIYSLASPRRQHPRTGVVHKSVIKPIGASFEAKTVDTDKGLVTDVTIEPAAPAEIEDTVAVMGGEDWEMWISALEEAGLLAPGVRTMAYSYIGPEVTWPIYRNGTIGLAKEDLEAVALRLNERLQPRQGRAFVSINKALVTQASSAIPVVPLYISLLYKVMKEKGLHEGCIEQMDRLFRTRLYGQEGLQVDPDNRIHMDDWEMREDVQAAVHDLWADVSTENLPSVSDIQGYRKEFLRLFGFGLEGIDYQAEVDPAMDFSRKG